MIFHPPDVLLGAPVDFEEGFFHFVVPVFQIKTVR
jgi:hypothetical protein